jgi:uncharacterized protein
MMLPTATDSIVPIPARAGIGLRFPHLLELLATRPALALLEVHSENLFGLPPAVEQRLFTLRADYSFSLHGVGLSLGSADGIDEMHLMQLADAAAKYQPMLVSEHLSWSRINNINVPDLLPLPYSREALNIVCRNIDSVQTILNRPIAIENISAYVRFSSSEMDEVEFLSQLVARTGCQLLVDINNLYVNQLNHGEDVMDFLDKVPAHAVAEYHLAGPTRVEQAGVTSYIDTHATPVPAAVWSLYKDALQLIGVRPTIVEWDQDLPALSVLVAEANKANAYLYTVERERVA